MSLWPLALAWGQTPPLPSPRPLGVPPNVPGGLPGTPPLPPRPVPTQPSIPASSPEAVPPPTPAPTATTAEITVRHDTLSVQLHEYDVQTAIRTIASQGHIEVKHLDSLPSTRISITFTDVPVVVGLKRLLRAADVAGYVLITGKEGDANKVQRLVFVPSDETSKTSRSAQPRSAAGTPLRPTLTPPNVPPPPQPPPLGQPGGETDEGRPATIGSSASVFEDLRTNAAAKRLVSQLMHPNEQVRERAFESLIRLVGEDDKQRELLEFLEPVMESLASEDKQTQEEARGEIRKLLSQ